MPSDYAEAIVRLHNLFETGLTSATSVLTPAQLARANSATEGINNAIARTIAELSLSPKMKSMTMLTISSVLRALNTEEVYRVIASEKILLQSIIDRVDWVSGRLDDRLIKDRPPLSRQAASQAQWMGGIADSEVQAVEAYGAMYDFEPGCGSHLTVSQAPPPGEWASRTRHAISALREKYHVVVRLGDEVALFGRIEYSNTARAYDRILSRVQPGLMRVMQIHMGDHYAGCSPEEARKTMPAGVCGLTVLDLAAMFLGFPDMLNFVDHLDIVCAGNHWRGDDGKLHCLLFTQINGRRLLTSQPADFCRGQTAVATKELRPMLMRKSA